MFAKSPADRLIGIRAKKLIPAGYMIIVEPVSTDPYNNEGIMIQIALIISSLIDLKLVFN